MDFIFLKTIWIDASSVSSSLCLPLSNIFQITVFRMGSEGHQDIDLAILTALLKGGCVCTYACVLKHECEVSGLHFTVALQGCCYTEVYKT